MSMNETQHGGSIAAHQHFTDTPRRRVLGDVSPNVKPAAPVPAFLKRPAASSPLKRSFTAAMDSYDGLKYLKRRKLSDDESLSQVDGMSESVNRGENEASTVESGRFRPIFPPPSAKDTQVSLPGIAEPSPTEPNTPSDEGESTQGSSAERKSFSSLINYDPSSQPTTLVFKTVSPAELLKLRLRVAMFKVRTNQIDVPFISLQVPDRPKSPRSLTAQAVEEAVAQLRREAQEVMARQPTSIPKLLPAPILKPTAYSSRMIHETNLPSSPPVSLSPDKLPTLPTDVSTPRREYGRYGTPLGSVERLRRPEPELTSSAVKGRVAEGLLGLRHAS